MPGTSFSNDQNDGIVTADGFTVAPAAVQLAIAAGSNSQSGALAITKPNVILVTVSATTRAVRLPTAATGKVVRIANNTTTQAKCYPATGQKIGAAATNVLASARVLANKAIMFVGTSSTKWTVLQSA